MSDPQFLAGERLPAGKLQEAVTSDTYAPSLVVATGTNPTLGAGSATNALVRRNGALVYVVFSIAFGTSGVAAGSGSYELTLPPDLGFHPDIGQGTSVGVARLVDSSGSNVYFLTQLAARTDTDRVRFMRTETSTDVTHASPLAWAANDLLRGSFTYITDFT